MRELVVREHERIPVRDSDASGKYITQYEFDALIRICDKHSVSPFVSEYRSIKFVQFCGVVQTAGLCIEVLPKIADNDTFDRSLLLQMLALAADFPVASLKNHLMGLQNHSLLSVMARWFCEEVFALCHQGLVRNYVVQHDDLPVIRGRWHPELDLQRFPGRKDRLNCEFDELTPDNPHNRILKAALRRVKGLFPGNAGIKRDTETLLAWFIEVADAKVTREDLRRLPSNRLVLRYRSALIMAEWFLTERAMDLSSGANESLSLLFDMNALFQAVLGSVMRKTLPSAFSLREEGPRIYLTRSYDGTPRFQMKPDFCILQGNDIYTIIDAKWKRLNPQDTKGKWGISQSDVYQLNAYATAYECPHIALVYPGHAELRDENIRPSYNFLIKGNSDTGQQLKIEWVFLDSDSGEHSLSRVLQNQVFTLFSKIGIIQDSAQLIS